MNQLIYFYRTADEYGCFSNFFPAAFQLDGITWRTSEHYFQAQKYVHNAVLFQQIQEIESPMKAAELGRSRDVPMCTEWDEIKLSVMRRCVFEKFAQNSELRDILLSTGDAELIEKTTGDYFWGCGRDGSGANMLGVILMEVRADITSINRNQI